MHPRKQLSSRWDDEPSYAIPEVRDVLRKCGTRPTASLINILLILERDPRWEGRIVANRRNGKTYVDGRLLDGVTTIEAYRWICHHYGINASCTHVRRAIRHIGSLNVIESVIGLGVSDG